MGKPERSIFKQGSSTFFWSSLLFPKKVRRDIFDLYSFVRIADDYVDELPTNPQSFYELKNLWLDATKSIHYGTDKMSEDSINERAVKNMVRLSQEHKFDTKWVIAFLDAMESDLTWPAVATGSSFPKNNLSQKAVKNYKYNNSKKLLFYIHGSAEVVGLMMSRIMDLPKAGDEHAKALGRSLQTINFIRDIKQDNHLGRCYFFNEDFEKFGLDDLSESTARSNPQGFRSFILDQTRQYINDQRKATEGFKYMPRRYRIAVKTAVDLYAWTATEIARDPFLVFKKKVKPTRLRILKTAMSNIITV